MINFCSFILGSNFFRAKSAPSTHPPTYLRMPSNSAHESPEGDDLLLADDVLQVGGGAVQRHLLNRLGRLSGVLQGQKELLSHDLAALLDPRSKQKSVLTPEDQSEEGLREVSASRLTSITFPLLSPPLHGH